MDATPRLTEAQSDETATRVVQEVRARGRLANYRPLVRNLPVWLRQHGLGQTMAYLQARGAGRADSPYLMMYAQLGEWLRERLGLPPGDVLAALTRADSRIYLLASEEASALALALRRAMAREDASPGTSGGSTIPPEVE
ncbi:MAG: type III-B CRISPR module-associated protein Cmr5 [Chloroflexi bacterium]|nr:type III-B CRISPR module-associated protein Cmr5 [Chloroflexota bacterium]